MPVEKLRPFLRPRCLWCSAGSLWKVAMVHRVSLDLTPNSRFENDNKSVTDIAVILYLNPNKLQQSYNPISTLLPLITAEKKPCGVGVFCLTFWTDSVLIISSSVFAVVPSAGGCVCVCVCVWNYTIFLCVGAVFKLERPWLDST